MKPTAKANDLLVQGTNDSSIVSKCSMSAVGYFEDRFLRYFAKKNARRSPLINRGYFVRAKAMDYAIHLFLQTFEAEKKQILSLGAGFDSSYFRLKDKGLLSNTRFLELDFPDVVRRKSKLIHTTPGLSKHIIKSKEHDILDCDKEIITNDYSLIGCDLTDLNRLESVLKSIDYCWDSMTLIFSEVVLTYVNKESCSKLIKWLADTFNNSVFILYEQIHPDDAFGIIMKKHFNTLQSPLKCIDVYPTIVSQICRFNALGWQSSNAMDMNEFYYNYVTEEERDRIRRIEPFDEFEDHVAVWKRKCFQPYIVIANENRESNGKRFLQNGDCISFLIDVHNIKTINDTKPFQSVRGKSGKQKSELKKKQLLHWKRTNENEEQLKRFGHQLICLTERQVLLTCGFGCSSNKHQRLKNGVLVSFSEEHATSPLIQSFPIFERSRLFHSISRLTAGSFFLFGGRESPLKPCLDYGIFKIDQNCIDDIPKDATKELSSKNSITTFIWRGQLQTQSNAIGRNSIAPCPRWRHTATRVAIEGKEWVLIFGGRNEQCSALSDCWLFDVSQHAWTEVQLQTESGAIQPRHSHSACLWGDDKLIITGGLNQDSQPINRTEILHFKDGRIIVESVSFDERIPPRYSHDSHIVNNDLWLIGGVNLDISSHILVINLHDLKWKEYNLQMKEFSSWI